jgi:hypothetical protein
MKASRRFSFAGQTAKALTLGGFLAWASSGYAENMTPVKLEVTLAASWDELVGSSAGLNNTSESDTWVAIVDIKAVPFLIYPECPQAPCPARIDVNEQDANGFSFNISSTSEIPADHLAVRTDRRNSFDVFDFSSNVNASGTDYLRFVDTEVGVFYPPEGTSSVSWRLDRRVVTTLPAGYVQRDTEGFIAALRDPSLTYNITEFFANNMLQIAYTKTGTAKVTNVRVLSEVAPTAPLTCRYEVATDWGTGYVAFVYLKNETAEPVDGWEVDINFQDPLSITNSWSAVFDGSTGALTAAPLAWNQVINPGQEINFGFQGDKIPGQTSAASVAGSVCR